MTVIEASEWLEERQAAGISYSLERIEAVLDRLDRPDNKLSVIHIAGTNGKGTVGQYLSNVLISNGLSVGSFETPSFGEVWEQLQYNGTGIDSSQFAEALSSIASEIEEVEHVRNELVSPFEVMTALAYYMFAHVLPTDAVIVEAGMGGRLDATNAVKNPAATVITSVDLDHETYLGPTLADIAFEKAGIIKHSAPVFTGASEPALRIIVNRAVELGTNVVDLQTFPPCSWTTDLFAPVDRLNASIAAETAVYMLQKLNVKVPDEQVIKTTISQTKLAGRMEKIAEQPKIIVDTAHNPAAVKVLIEKIGQDCTISKVQVLFAAMKDKKYLEMLDILAEANVVKKVYWCRFNDVRAAVPTLKEANSIGVTIRNEDCQEIITNLLTDSGSDEVFVITGSHAFVKLMRNHVTCQYNKKE
ncbi:bifunctional folylpolyglutamate synthase/dihydrofolate synthase [Salisediminibacterium halotolerans]|uniref:tetrahydrofolate synthase n=1 Tax=Salisediminibacterium halotolerans TaxID=517425 RepID=A0A1H9R4E9_9BACI|nr:cyanophycin synthetase [Salisediminibacterium haloalkalitolerans]SER67580.1 dihydrofolate synthase / folylpolyglutamate synthase [Salisediminibacterium haloalkalitolerans]